MNTIQILKQQPENSKVLYATKTYALCVHDVHSVELSDDAILSVEGFFIVANTRYMRNVSNFQRKKLTKYSLTKFLKIAVNSAIETVNKDIQEEDIKE